MAVREGGQRAGNGRGVRGGLRAWREAARARGTRRLRRTRWAPCSPPSINVSSAREAERAGRGIHDEQRAGLAR